MSILIQFSVYWLSPYCTVLYCTVLYCTVLYCCPRVPAKAACHVSRLVQTRRLLLLRQIEFCDQQLVPNHPQYNRKETVKQEFNSQCYFREGNCSIVLIVNCNCSILNQHEMSRNFLLVYSTYFVIIILYFIEKKQISAHSAFDLKAPTSTHLLKLFINISAAYAGTNQL